MNLQEIRDKGCIVFECVSGSRAYGLATETSDTDIKGVFIAPRDNFYSLEFPEQVNSDNNNVVFYELRKFIDLLAKNNPNMLEMLDMPADCVLFKHPLYDKIRAGLFLSRLCKESFAGYAMTQLKKARGLNKKILNPMAKEKKLILDFCYVSREQGSIPVRQFLEENNMKQEHCGLAAIPHMREMYGLYHSAKGIYKGIMRTEDSLDVALSSVAEGEAPVSIMSFNKDGYSKYCKDYKEYWSWVEDRNEDRYSNTIAHGKNYDAKNMMHTFRLLDMAEEIARQGRVIVRRPNRELLLNIKKGDFAYEDLVQKAETRLDLISEAYSASDLPDFPDLERINALLVNVRKEYYR